MNKTWIYEQTERNVLQWDDSMEAQRYLHLAKLLPVRKTAEALRSSVNRVLVLGDYLPSVTKRQMEWLVDAATSLPPDTRFIVKPHPLCPIRADEYPELQLQITDAPLVDLFSDCDVVYTSNVTSSAVDAYSAGIPVVSVLDGDAFNMSPLRGLSGIVYVTNPSELAAVLVIAKQRERVLAEPYFCLDEGLPRWRKLLGLNAAANDGAIAA